MVSTNINLSGSNFTLWMCSKWKYVICGMGWTIYTIKNQVIPLTREWAFKFSQRNRDVWQPWRNPKPISRSHSSFMSHTHAYVMCEKFILRQQFLKFKFSQRNRDIWQLWRTYIKILLFIYVTHACICNVWEIYL